LFPSQGTESALIDTLLQKGNSDLQI